MGEKKRIVPIFKNPLEEFRPRKNRPNLEYLAGESGSKDWVVRVFNQNTLREHLIGFAPEHSFEKEALQAKALFAELQEKYHIRIPVQFVIAGDGADEALYILTEHVEVLAYSQLPPREQKALAKETVETYRNLLQYYRDKFTTGESFLYDITELKQHVYAKRKEDTEPHFYLIDTDPYFVSNASIAPHATEKRNHHHYLYLFHCVIDLDITLQYLSVKAKYDVENLLDETEDLYIKIENAMNKTQ